MHRSNGKRRTPRLTATEMTLTVNGRTYRVVNINRNGVGFLIDAPHRVGVGEQLEAMLDCGRLPVRVCGIARHVSQITPADRPLPFRSGWVCGVEFSTRHDRDGGELFDRFLADSIAEDSGEDDE